MFERFAYPLAPVALSCALAFSAQAATVPGAALSTPEGARETLLANVRFLISKGRADLARAVINQVLAIQADDAETLVLFGDLELRAGRSANAHKVLERLQQLDPKGAPTREMEALIHLYTVDRARLTQLRTLRDSGEYPQAQVVARALFPNGQAPGSLGREFADLLGSQTFTEPRRALHGAGARANGVINRHMQHRGPTGLARLDARPARRLGLRHERVANALAKPPRAYRPAAADIALSSAYTALNAQEYATAEEGFRRVLRLRPGSAAAYGGLGILRARQGQHQEALQFYAQAQERERNRRLTTWNDLARTSAYWQLIERAQGQLDQSEFVEARRTLRTALLSQPQEPEAAVLLAQADLAQSDNQSAVPAFKELTRRLPNDDRVWRGLLTALMRQPGTTGDVLEQAWNDADAAASAHALKRSALVSVADVRALARRQLDAGHPDQAGSTLDRGLRFVPSDAWLRHDRARLFLSQGQVAQANRLMREGEALAPQAADMKHAVAVIAMAQEQDEAALQTLEAVPESERSPGMRSLAASARFEAIMHRLQDLARSGSRSGAGTSLDEAATLAEGDPARQLRVARTQIMWGADDAAAARLMAMDVSQLSSQDRVARGLLLSDTGRHVEGAAALAQLVPDWPQTVPQSMLVNAQYLVASRQIEAALVADARAQAQDVAAKALTAWDATGAKRSAVVAAAQANLWLQAGADQWALASADAALAEDPNSTSALLTRARMRTALDDREGARGDLTRAGALLSPTAVDDRLEAVRLWTDLGERDTARQWLAPLISRQPGNANLRLEAARIARLDGDYAGALQHLRYASGLQPATPNLLNVTMGASEALAATSLPNDSRSLGAVREAIAAIEARRQPRIEIGVNQFGQRGDAGLSHLRGQETTAAVYWPVNYQGHVFGQVDRLRLDAGSLPAAGSLTREFGQVATLPGAGTLTTAAPQTTDGYAVGVGWVDEVRRVDIGVVGMGLNRASLTGGWREDFKLAGREATLDVSRRVETSSLLAYGGARDPVSNEIWGGVTNNSAALRVTEELASGWRQSGTVRVGAMTGDHVGSNPFVQLQGRWTRSFHETVNTSVRSGVALNLWHYQHNRSGFTYGQGGYYSPQAYVSAQLPLEVAHRDGPWTHGFRGHLTYTWAKESSAPYFPMDASLQSAAGNPVRAASINHGLGVALRGTSEYRINPQWSVGALAEWERSRDYNPYRVGLYLRHYFNGAEGPAPLPPRAVTPYVRY